MLSSVKQKQKGKEACTEQQGCLSAEIGSEMVSMTEKHLKDGILVPLIKLRQVKRPRQGFLASIII